MRILIITCYIGKLPQYINLWLKSCANNPAFDFLLVTDQDMEVILPSNVCLERCSLNQVKERFQSCLDFPIALERAYKLCDYKPIYGLAFADKLEEYDFWGHCDIDMIFGNLKSFITDEKLKNYDRIGSFGHLTLYRNNSCINELFKKRGAAFNYEEVFQSSYNYGFDERYGMNLICAKNNIDFWNPEHSLIADKAISGSGLRLDYTPNYEKQLLIWKDSNIYHYYLGEDNIVTYDEKMYFHFSKTDYRCPKDMKTSNYYLRSYGCEIRKYNKITPEEIKRESEAFNRGDRWYKNRIIRFVKLPIMKKYIYIRQKLVYWRRK